ncbi:MAG: hypothetical protein KAW41_04255 [Candidatus Diapherotrites archaeon]|nr:hypothetical protein [Candidatus Diapherotrites archaeon]
MAVSLTNRQVNKLLEEIVGHDGVLVLKACDLKKGTTDEGIAKKTKLKLSTIRSQLNQLHYRGLIRYHREKNVDTNWYTYTWFTNADKINEVISGEWANYLGKIEKQLDYESNYVFYSCGNGCGKLPFELASEYDFTCPDCGNELQNINNKSKVRELLGEIKEVKSLMKQLK